jgi:hypothetical protein
LPILDLFIRETAIRLAPFGFPGTAGNPADERAKVELGEIAFRGIQVDGRKVRTAGITQTIESRLPACD